MWLRDPPTGDPSGELVGCDRLKVVAAVATVWWRAFLWWESRLGGALEGKEEAAVDDG